MARITVEDCLEHVTDQFALVHLTSLRYRQLSKGIKPTVESTKNKLIVTALREIAANHVKFRENVHEMLMKAREKATAESERSVAANLSGRHDIVDEPPPVTPL